MSEVPGRGAWGVGRGVPCRAVPFSSKCRGFKDERRCCQGLRFINSLSFSAYLPTPTPTRLPPWAPRLSVVLAEVIQAFSTPENAVRMDEARDNACNDMGKMLQFVLPVATQIQQEVIKAYGFSCDGEGGSTAGWQWNGSGRVCRVSGSHSSGSFPCHAAAAAI